MKIKIELDMPKELMDEFIEARGKKKGEQPADEQLKEAVIEYIKRSIGSHRRRKAMEAVREQTEAARKAIDDLEELGIK